MKEGRAWKSKGHQKDLVFLGPFALSVCFAYHVYPDGGGGTLETTVPFPSMVTERLETDLSNIVL